MVVSGCDVVNERGSVMMSKTRSWETGQVRRRALAGIGLGELKEGAGC